MSLLSSADGFFGWILRQMDSLADVDYYDCSLGIMTAWLLGYYDCLANRSLVDLTVIVLILLLLLLLMLEGSAMASLSIRRVLTLV